MEVVGNDETTFTIKSLRRDPKIFKKIIAG
jgi:hypothetical protein